MHSKGQRRYYTGIGLFALYIFLLHLFHAVVYGFSNSIRHILELWNNAEVFRHDERAKRISIYFQRLQIVLLNTDLIAGPVFFQAFTVGDLVGVSQFMS